MRPSREEPYRPRRSCLYLPGSNLRALEKAKTIGADTLIIDLEDAVAPDAKELARQQACDAVASRSFGHREVVVRVNAADTLWGDEDLKSAAAAAPDAILLPKVQTAADIIAISARLDAIGASPDLALWAMVETPRAILNIGEIASTCGDTRLRVLVMGTNDLAKDLQTRPLKDRGELVTALALTVTAARAYGVTAIDGVFNDISDHAGFEAECAHGAALGFTGKTLIHPGQIEICNQVYAPSDRDLADAQRIVAAFADPDNKGKGVIKVDGQMVELLHLERARQIIAVREAITAAEAA